MRHGQVVNGAIKRLLLALSSAGAKRFGGFGVCAYVNRKG